MSENADRSFICAVACLTSRYPRYCWRLTIEQMQWRPIRRFSSFHTLWLSGRFDWTFVAMAFFLTQRLMYLWFSTLLWWFSDVPDAPQSLVLSDHNRKSVKLKWIPGDDHNSSTTGKKEHPCVQVSAQTVHPCLLPGMVLKWRTHVWASCCMNNRFVWYHLVQYVFIIDSSKHEVWFVSQRSVLHSWGLDKQPFGRNSSSAGALWSSLCLSTEFIIEYEESKWEPGNWKELLRVPGNHNSAVLKLHGHVDYRFRVYGVNAVGAGPPSESTESYTTPSRGLSFTLMFVTLFDKVLQATWAANTAALWTLKYSGLPHNWIHSCWKSPLVCGSFTGDFFH